MGISTHILDTARGRPAAGIAVSLARRDDAGWTVIRETHTDADGRAMSLLPASQDEESAGAFLYRLRFATAPYFAAQQQPSLYPYIDIVFVAESEREHYHIPLLLTANGYTTYRGS